MGSSGDLHQVKVFTLESATGMEGVVSVAGMGSGEGGDELVTKVVGRDIRSASWGGAPCGGSTSAGFSTGDDVGTHRGWGQ